MKKRKNFGVVIIGLLLVLLFCILISSTLGAANISAIDSFRVICSKFPGIRSLASLEGLKQTTVTIVWKVRLPRIFLSGLTGCGLAMVGASFQGLFRNPLADPHILGISSGAALGATLAMLSGISLQIFGMGIVSVCAFIGASITVLLVYHLGHLGGRNNITGMLLTGTAISTLLSSMISLLMTFHREELEKVYLWTLGSFASADWTKIRVLLVVLVICLIVIFYHANDLNVLLTGEDSARSLGIQLDTVKRNVILAATLLVATCVSVSGIIGFVGLIIPHCTRLISGPDHRRLLPLCCLNGAIFMIVCDTIARTVAAPMELPVGIITALFGAPYFIFLLYYNQRKSQW